MRYDTVMRSIQEFLLTLGEFIGGTLIPFLFGLALLVFLVNAVRFFIIGGTNPTEQAKAKTLATYSIFTFVFLVSIWGIVNFFVGGLGLDNDNAVTPDYFDYSGY